MREIDKKQLKIISMEFRTIANRLVNCHPQTGMDLLKKFLSYIDENELISAFIQSNIDPNDFQPVERGTCFTSMGENKQEEISFTYQYLKYAVINFKSFYLDIAWGYGNDANDSVKEFCHRVILPLVNYIEGYLTEIGIQMGFDEDSKFNINVNGGLAQVNVADRGSTLNATQNNVVDMDQLNKLINDLRNAASPDISKDDTEQINNSIEIICNEVTNGHPKKAFLKTALNGLKAIKDTAEFTAAVAAIYQFLTPFF